MTNIETFKQRVKGAKSRKSPEIRISLQYAEMLLAEIIALENKPPVREVVEVMRYSQLNDPVFDGGTFK
jgi:hypothetical protein